MIKACSSETDYATLKHNSREKPVFLLKHSTKCPISAAAHREFEEFARCCDTGECWKVLVIEERELSTAIARETGITHQSPQVLLFLHEKPVWHTSHRDITNQCLKGKMAEHQ